MPRPRAGGQSDAFRLGASTAHLEANRTFLATASAKWTDAEWARAVAALQFLEDTTSDRSYAAETSTEMCDSLRWAWADPRKQQALLTVSAFALRAVAGEPLEAKPGARPGASGGPSGTNAAIPPASGAIPLDSPTLPLAATCFGHVARMANLLLVNSHLAGDDGEEELARILGERQGRSGVSALISIPALSAEVARSLVRTHTLQGLALALARAPERLPRLKERLALAVNAASLMEGLMSYMSYEARQSRPGDSDDEDEDEYNLYDSDDEGGSVSGSDGDSRSGRARGRRESTARAEEVLCAVRISAVLEHLARALLLLAAEVPRAGGGGAGEELRGKLNEAQRRSLAALDSHLTAGLMLWGHTSTTFLAHSDYGSAVRYLFLAHLGAQLSVAEGAGAEGSGSGSGGGSSSGAGGGGRAGGEAAAEGGAAAAHFYGLPLERLPPAVVDGCGGCARPQCLSSKPVLRSDSVRSALKYLALREGEDQQGEGAGGSENKRGCASADRIAGPAARYALAMRVAGAAEAHWREYRSKLAPSGSGSTSVSASGSKPESDGGAGPSSSAAAPPSAPQRPLTQKQLRQAKQAAARQQAAAAAAAAKAKPGRGEQGSGGGADPDPLTVRRKDRWQYSAAPGLGLDALASAAPAAAALARRDEARAGRAKGGEAAAPAGAGAVVPLPAEWYSAAVRALHAAMDDPRALAVALHTRSVEEVLRRALHQDRPGPTAADEDDSDEDDSDEDESEWYEANEDEAFEGEDEGEEEGEEEDPIAAEALAAALESAALALRKGARGAGLRNFKGLSVGVGRAVRAGLLPCLERLLRTAVGQLGSGLGSMPGAAGDRAAAWAVSVWQVTCDFEALLPALSFAPPSQSARLVESLAQALPGACMAAVRADVVGSCGPSLLPSVLLRKCVATAALEAATEAAGLLPAAEEPQPPGAGPGLAAASATVCALALVAARLLPAASRAAQQLSSADRLGSVAPHGLGASAATAANAAAAEMLGAMLTAAVLEWVPLLAAACLDAARRGDGRAAAEFRALLLTDLDVLALLDLALAFAKAGRCSWLHDTSGPAVQAAQALTLVCPAELAAAFAPLYGVEAGLGRRKGRGPAPRQGLAAALRAELAKGGAAADPEAARRLEALLARPGGAGGGAGGGGAGAVGSSSVAVEEAEREVRKQLAYWGPAASRLAPPSEAAALGPLCAHPACANLAGDSEGALLLPARCGRCGLGGYCGAECAAAHGRGSHGGVCGLGRGGDK
ncbi:hypothetical protein HYH03_016320 [Edaphochlamys debaryana]|uniref:MYND-type domain-containing protein n=1 Tax=Edaphochlamys debaryana TaxID=47281 RepID=A0A835XK49_9CHLO|nr:hypothetical protein HYH03_016320 [Edaphochlamys debaryana]|eukprot:KAG2484934.1 hypothetical protein HYH03_016320 [Edaphochlamys debaryana]